MNIIPFLVASILLVVFGVMVVTPLIVDFMDNEQLEAYPVEASAVQTLACPLMDTVTGDGYVYTRPQSLSNSVTLYVKSFTNDYFTVNKLVAIGYENNPLVINETLPPYGTLVKTYKADWAPGGSLSFLAFPGDVVTIGVSGGVDIEPGTLVMMNSGIRYVNQLISMDYECFLEGKWKYLLAVNGDTISSTISLPGCAGVQVGAIPEISDMFLLLELTNVYLVEGVVPFFFWLPQSNKSMYIIVTGGIDIGTNDSPIPVTINPETVYYIALDVDDGAKLYANGDLHNVVFTPPFEGPVYVGVGRTPVGVNPPDLKFCAEYSGGGHCIEMNLSTRTYRVLKGNTVLKSGVIPLLNYGDEVSTALRGNGVAVYLNPQPSADHVAMLKYNGNPIRFYMDGVQNALIDMLVAWEDLVGYYQPGSSNIDGNGDEWVRVTYTSDGKWRVAGYIARGGFKHVFYINNDVIFVKESGRSWSRLVSGVYYEYYGGVFPKYYNYVVNTVEPSTTIPLFAIFKNSKLVINGLTSGQEIIISYSGGTKRVTASGPTMTLDLLDMFTVQEIIETVKQGGFEITVRVPEIQLLTMIPTVGKLYVTGENTKMWIDVEMQVLIDCFPSLRVNSDRPLTLTVTTSDYRYWTVKLGNEVLGMFPKVSIIVYNGVVTLRGENGVYRYEAPYNTGTIRITTSPGTYVGVLLGTEINAIPKVKTVEIRGVFYEATFSLGR